MATPVLDPATKAQRKAERDARFARVRAHGGRREGAGRKPFTVLLSLPFSKLDFGEDIKNDQLSPKDMLRLGARVMFRAAFRRKSMIDRVALKESMEYARMAAPYFDPALSWQALGRFPRPGDPPKREKEIGNGAVIAMPDNGRRLPVLITQEKAAPAPAQEAGGPT